MLPRMDRNQRLFIADVKRIHGYKTRCTYWNKYSGKNILKLVELMKHAHLRTVG